MEFTWLRAGGCCVHAGSLSLLGFALGCRCFHSGSLGSLGLALGVVGFIWSGGVHLASRLGSLCSFGVVWFGGVPPRGSWVNPGSFGSLGFALVVVEFALGVVGFIRGRWDHMGSPWWSLGLYGVVGFSRFRPGGRWVHPRSFSSLGFALWAAGFNRHHLVHSVSP